MRNITGVIDRNDDEKGRIYQIGSNRKCMGERNSDGFGGSVSNRIE
jgi:hypothetical protein